MEGRKLNKKEKFELQFENKKTEELKTIINTKWNYDIWDLNDTFFKQFGEKATELRFLNLTGFKANVKTEIKYFFAYQLLNQKWKLNTLVGLAPRVKIFAKYLNTYYPRIKSISEINIKKFILEWKTFLLDNKLRSSGRHDFKILIDFYIEFYDERDEVDKDIWDLRKIPYARFPKHKTQYLIDFTKVPEQFRESVKSYLKTKLATNSDLGKRMIALNFFFQFLNEKNKKMKDFNSFKRDDIENFIIYINTKKQANRDTLYRYLTHTKDYFQYLEKVQHSVAPKLPTLLLFFKEDFPKMNFVTNENTIKYIPDNVIIQLEKILQTEPNQLKIPFSDRDKEIIPIVILLLATGWRISDILNLRYHNCLIYNNGWYLQGDIPKTSVKNHRVPIENEIAKIVQAVVENIKMKSTTDNNPDKYLFPTLSGPRITLPLRADRVQSKLNDWAKKYNIIDDNGEIYYFKNHAFRHTKGVELINSGMNLIHVQKWFAHSSPEMTMVYAKITDDSLKKEWIKAKENTNFFKIDIDRGEIKSIEDEDLIEWEYIRHNIEAAKVPLGYCMASQKMGCPYVETPCLTCSNFCTTPENLPEFEMEIKNLESLIERTKDMPIWNEKNQKKYEKLQSIKETLSIGKIHHPAGKKSREYPKEGTK